MNRFVHLKVHTEYSLIDSIVRVGSLVASTERLGMPAIAVTDQELQKAKNILLANFYRQMKTINGKANTLGSYEVFFGDYRKLFGAADEYSKVTGEDIKRVVKQYFSKNNRTVATLVPESEN